MNDREVIQILQAYALQRRYIQQLHATIKRLQFVISQLKKEQKNELGTSELL